MNDVLRNRRALAIVFVALMLIILITSARYLTAEQYQGLAGALQALGVVVALFVAAGTLTSDSENRRVDRVLQLHEMMTSGEVSHAAVRLSDHLRRHGVGGKARRASLEQLRCDPVLRSYCGQPAHSPYLDARMVIRFFEKADAARRANAVSVPLFHELVARHATWFRLAIRADAAEPDGGRLACLAIWADEYARIYRPPLPNYIENWGRTRQRDFGSPAVASNPNPSKTDGDAVPKRSPAQLDVGSDREREAQPDQPSDLA